MWVGEDFGDVYYILLLLVLPYIVSLTQNIANDAILIENRIKIEALVVFFTSVLSFILAVPLSRLYGAIGCAVAIFAGLILNLLIMNLYYQKKMCMGVRGFFEACHLSILPILIVYTAIAFAAKHLLGLDSWPQLIYGVIVYVAIYCAIVYFLLFSQEEKQFFRNGLK